MTKMIFSLAIAAATLLPLSASAQSNNPTSCPVQKESCKKACENKDKACDKVCDRKCDKACDKACDRKCDKPCDKAGRKCRIVSRDCFAGLDLTADQQNAIDKLQKKRMAQHKADREKAKADRKADRESMKTKRDQEKKEYLDELRKILTPEQYTKFLENNFTAKRIKLDKSKDQKFAKTHKMNRTHKMDKDRGKAGSDSSSKE